ncbi:MAG: hypothetical protein KF723_22425 [Rhizobiaceae bacterium]|nr:hypothetical protein [Rhizobiaceae bacterium]
MAYKSIKNRRAYARKHYRENATLYKQRAREHTNRMRKVLREFVADYLSSHSCVDCGEADPIVLEFDHRDPLHKVFDIASVRNRGYSLASLKREIAKCDVRCANCHRRRTHAERLANGHPVRGRLTMADLVARHCGPPSE